MGEGIKFERNVEYPDGIHDGVEKNEYEEHERHRAGTRRGIHCWQ